MPTNLALDDRLIEQARKIGRHKTKKEAVNAALEEYVRHRKQAAIKELFGKVEYWPGFDHKRLRGKR